MVQIKANTHLLYKYNKHMRKKFIAISVIVGFIVFVVIAIVTNLFNSGDLPVQIAGALLEAVVTALITYFLLTGQTTQEEIKERQVKVFEKKQEIYHNFLEELKRIIQDGEIKILLQKEKKELDESVDELKDLLFQLGYLQMHTDKEKANQIFELVAKIIQTLNDFNSENEDKQKLLPEYYASLSESLFKIIAIMKSDLYGKEIEPIQKNKIQSILQECNLFIDNKEFNKYDIQNYFWNEIQNQLNILGYNIVKKDFTQDVNEYYARARNRHRWHHFTFEVYKSKQNQKPIRFRIEIENNYYYGFVKDEINQKNDLITKCIKETSSSFEETDWWFGWKYPDRYDLDFWRLNSDGFEQLKNPRKKEAYIKEIANEIDMYIKKFITIAEKNNL